MKNERAHFIQGLPQERTPTGSQTESMAGRGGAHLRTVIKAIPMVCLLALMLGIKSINDSTPIGLFYFLEKGTALTGTLAVTRDESTSPEPT